MQSRPDPLLPPFTIKARDIPCATCYSRGNLFQPSLFFKYKSLKFAQYFGFSCYAPKCAEAFTLTKVRLLSCEQTLTGEYEENNERIDDLLPSASADLSSSGVALETAVCPGVYLDGFNPDQLSSTISSSKPSTCLLDPIPTRLLKDELPLICSSLLDIINVSLLTGHVPHSFKVSVINYKLLEIARDTCTFSTLFSWTL